MQVGVEACDLEAEEATSELATESRGWFEDEEVRRWAYKRTVLQHAHLMLAPKSRPIVTEAKKVQAAGNTCARC